MDKRMNLLSHLDIVAEKTVAVKVEKTQKNFDSMLNRFFRYKFSNNYKSCD